MKTQPNGAEITSEDHALAAAILADIPYVVTHPPAIKKDKSKSKKVPRELSAEVASPSSTSPAIAVPAVAAPAAAAPVVAAPVIAAPAVAAPVAAAPAVAAPAVAEPVAAAPAAAAPVVAAPVVAAPVVAAPVVAAPVVAAPAIPAPAAAAPAAAEAIADVDVPVQSVPVQDPPTVRGAIPKIKKTSAIANATSAKAAHSQPTLTPSDAQVDDGPTGLTFRDLSLPEELCSALEAAGYRTPTDIQASTIPAMLAGRDVLGQAQTGTGKTAAFALPLLANIDVDIPETQVLVLAPTRELANQVSESFLKYGQHLRGLRVAPIYGGAPYVNQINALKRGAHVVVGTPGRIMDHMRESRLRIDSLKTLVLDEADEMLRMGFVDDVQWILDQCPGDKQIALFSATMPEPIRQIANKHLKSPEVVRITSRQQTADNIQQRFLVIEPSMKFEALTRIIEAEDFDGMIIFVKTKIATVEVADYLREHGYSAVPLNGDIAQNQRERTVEQLKEGVFNILVATDVAARGLDVQRITHVINYDLPADSEAYVHRIGRTGRAGRKGHAILFVSPKQRGFLREIDRAAGDSMEPMALPTAKDINAARVERFKERLVHAAAGEANPELFATFEKLLSQAVSDKQLDPIRIATGLAVMMHGQRPFFIHELPERLLNRNSRNDRHDRDSRRDSRPERPSMGSGGDQGPSETFRVEVGRIHGVKPGNLVGAIVNEIGLSPSQIGHIRIENDFSTVDLPSGMPRDLFKVIGRAWVLGRQLRISKLSDHPDFSDRAQGGGDFRSDYPRRPRQDHSFKDKRQSFGSKPNRERRK